MNLSLNNTYLTRGCENSLISYHYQSSLCTSMQSQTIPLVLIEQYSVSVFLWFYFFVCGEGPLCALFYCSRQLLEPDHFIWVIQLCGIFQVIQQPRCLHWEIKMIIIRLGSHPLQSDGLIFLSSKLPASWPLCFSKQQSFTEPRNITQATVQ